MYVCMYVCMYILVVTGNVLTTEKVDGWGQGVTKKETDSVLFGTISETISRCTMPA